MGRLRNVPAGYYITRYWLLYQINDYSDFGSERVTPKANNLLPKICRARLTLNSKYEFILPHKENIPQTKVIFFVICLLNRGRFLSGILYVKQLISIPRRNRFFLTLVRLPEVSSFGDGDCGARKIHTRARNFENCRRFPRVATPRHFARVCVILPAPQSPSPKLDTARNLNLSKQRTPCFVHTVSRIKNCHLFRVFLSWK